MSLIEGNGEVADARLEAEVARLPWWMAGTSAVSILIVLAGGHVRLAAGFAVGSAAAILAYGWLHRAVAVALEASEPRPARTLMLKFALRYPLLVMFVVLSYQTGWLPLRGVIAGLFVPAAGVIAACIVLLVRPASAGVLPAPLRPGGPRASGNQL